MKQKKTKMHEYSFLPEKVEGIALDNDNTEKCHQIFSVYYDKGYSSYRLNCAVICADFMRDASGGPPKDFAHNAKQSHKSRSAKRKTAIQYADYYEELAFGQTCFDGFSDKVYKPALVFSFLFNEKEDYAITDRFMTYGVGIIKDQLDYNAVNKSKKGKVEPETQLWQDVMRHQGIKGCRSVDKKHNAQSLTEKMSILVQQTARDEATRLGIEAIYLVNGNDLTAAFTGKKKNNFIPTTPLQNQNIVQEAWSMPITNVDTDVAVINGGLVHYFLSTGKNLFSREIIDALAMGYQTQFNSGIQAAVRTSRQKAFGLDD